MPANRPNLKPDLPTSFRGYDRGAIDQYLEQVEAGYLGLVAERDQLQEQVEVLTRELERHRDRENSVTQSLARAERVAAGLKLQAEREVAEERARLATERRTLEIEQVKAQRQSELLRQRAQAEAEAVVANAQAQAERTAHELTARADAEREAAERVLDETRARLAAMVTDLIKQLPVGGAGAPGHRRPQ